MTANGSNFDVTDDFGGRATFSRSDMETMAKMAAGVGEDTLIEHRGIKMLGHQAAQIARNL